MVGDLWLLGGNRELLVGNYWPLVGNRQSLRGNHGAEGGGVERGVVSALCRSSLVEYGRGVEHSSHGMSRAGFIPVRIFCGKMNWACPNSVPLCSYPSLG